MKIKACLHIVLLPLKLSFSLPGRGLAMEGLRHLCCHRLLLARSSVSSHTLHHPTFCTAGVKKLAAVHCDHS